MRGALLSSILLFTATATGCSASTPASSTPAIATSSVAAPLAAPSSGAAAAPVERPSAEEYAAAAKLVGTTPPEWQTDRWMNSPPLRLADLRGKVVLVRWWTAECPYCSATAPALRRFDRDYAGRGLVVVGMYHHKGDAPFDPRVYEDTSKTYGFTFPVAFDPEWKTLRSWLRGAEPGWTSLSFLLDRNGVVRQVHPGGQYVEGDADYAKMKADIEALLAEKGPW